MIYNHYYFQPTDKVYDRLELRSVTGIQFTNNDDLGILNSYQIYPVRNYTSAFHGRLYSISATYSVNGSFYEPTYTGTAIPLADAKAVGIEELQDSFNLFLDNATKGTNFNVFALVAAASKLEANRGQTVQSSLSTIQNLMSDFDTKVDEVEACTSVEDIQIILDKVSRFRVEVLVVTVSNGDFYVDGVQQPTLELVEGLTYRFNQADSSNTGHPLKIYTDSNKITEVTSDVTVVGTPGSTGSYTLFQPSRSGTFSYQCENHSNMGGNINVAASTAGKYTQDNLDQSDLDISTY